MAGSTIPLTFAVLTFVFAYLATNTGDKYTSLQLGNYILTYFIAAFTGFLSYSFAATGESPANVLAGFNDSFYFMLLLVIAVVLIKMLNAVLESMGKEVL